MTISDHDPPAAAHLGQAGSREKQTVALSSLIAAVFLTGMKLVVGVTTGSLGVLSEAAHSGLDLVAALVTWIAVRVSGRPADHEHTYGHGKIENLSALFEVVLLLATCMWIIKEAINRLFFKVVHVEATAVAFAVMVASIAVDVSRSRALSRTAKKYSSQALEADALHFSTDVWSSSVVILGLVGVLLASTPGLEWLSKADAVAALGVAGIVVWISWRLGRRTAAELLDEVPRGLRDDLLAAVRVPGVVAVGRVRVRRSGPETFADVTLSVSDDTSLEQAHNVASEAESAVSRVLPGADVVVHVEPAALATRVAGPGAVVATVRRIAARHNAAVHDVRLLDVLGRRSLELHLEVDGLLSVAEAHAKATGIEEAVRAAAPDLEHVITHIEPASLTTPAQPAAPVEELHVTRVLAELAREEDLPCQPHDVIVQRLGEEVAVSFHCTVDATTALAEAHTLTERFERALRERLPNLARVTIHVEPE
jgi:cation diffusion facilitator family transporter